MHAFETSSVTPSGCGGHKPDAEGERGGGGRREALQGVDGLFSTGFKHAPGGVCKDVSQFEAKLDLSDCQQEGNGPGPNLNEP